MKLLVSLPSPVPGEYHFPAPGTLLVTKGEYMKHEHTGARIKSSVAARSLGLPYRSLTGVVPGEVIAEDRDLPNVRRFLTQPVLALMQAVLLDALVCFSRQCPPGQIARHRQQSEAEKWIFSNDVHWPFAFLRICEALGLDPNYLRRKILHWHAAASRPRAFFGGWAL